MCAAVSEGVDHAVRNMLLAAYCCLATLDIEVGYLRAERVCVTLAAKVNDIFQHAACGTPLVCRSRHLEDGILVQLVCEQCFTVRLTVPSSACCLQYAAVVLPATLMYGILVQEPCMQRLL